MIVAKSDLIIARHFHDSIRKMTDPFTNDCSIVLMQLKAFGQTTPDYADCCTLIGVTCDGSSVVKM
jgi:hypothetical protein